MTVHGGNSDVSSVEGVDALGPYGAVLQSDDNFGRILAAYGGIFVAGLIAWGMVADCYRPDRFDVIGALVCLAGMAVIMFAPRGHLPAARLRHQPANRAPQAPPAAQHSR